MDEKRTTPYNFTNLDSSLIRSTKRTPSAPKPSALSPTPANDVTVSNETQHIALPASDGKEPAQPSSNHPITDVPMPPRHHEIIPPRDHTTTRPVAQSTIVAEVHKAVKQIGRFEGTHRYTEAEKDGLDEVIRAFKKKRIRTSENEIARIGINFLLEDFRRNGRDSVLSQVLSSLHE